MEEIPLTNLPYIEDIYEHYLQDRSSLDPSWIQFFQKQEESETSSSHQKGVSKELLPLSYDKRIDLLKMAYQNYGYLKKCVHSLRDHSSLILSKLSYATYGFFSEELDQLFLVNETGLTASLKEIIQQLETLYCSSIGVELEMIQDEALRQFIHQELCQRVVSSYSSLQKQKIWKELYQGEAFESFLHKKFTGQKRFSLEGAETLIPMLKGSFETMHALGIKEVEIGMAHRGRLTVLAEVLQKPYAHIFKEFLDPLSLGKEQRSGDVKYHLGWKTVQDHGIQLLLSPNPSHLEAVIPVIEGKVRAKQERGDTASILPLLIHGDASLSGQGVVYETLQLSQLEGYQTGGSLHIVINNHIGFTTSPQEGRSTNLCTDIASTFRVPIFHVKGDDPESCLDVIKLALKIRQQFHMDVFIDLNCDRKYGHNESDEPKFTQPLIYQALQQKKGISTLYLELQKEASIEPTWIEEVKEQFTQKLEKSLQNALEYEALQEESSPIQSRAAPIDGSFFQRAINHLTSIPKGFSLHPKLQKRQEEKKEALQNRTQKNVDFALAEELAYAELLSRGISIRLSGQDSCRGTFSHRHAVWTDQKTEERYTPLKGLENHSSFTVYNSPLSEYAVLGFELGYSLNSSNSLVIWEAQFGDFVNTAQVIIDQFLSSMEEKWNLKSSLTLFLPHGYEGQGAEHSSAKLERFLQLSCDDNWRVVQVTTPSQLFHILRDQGINPSKKPLILMTPKSLLRHVECRSSLEELHESSFQKILISPATSPLKMIFCTGKIYYDLIQQKKETVVIIRLEQLYPFPQEEIEEVIKHHFTVTTWVWAQEEPQNMGAWSYIKPLIEKRLLCPLMYAGRVSSSSPATGSHSIHSEQQANLIKEALR
ncbi:MAG: 2-oxoglutarate dehydrogenase E1 component [Candidatus Rhabdochlamydia sp.]